MTVHDDAGRPAPKGKELTPAEFTRQMPDEEDGAGPGAPETVEPLRGGPGDGSTRPKHPRPESEEDPSQGGEA